MGILGLVALVSCSVKEDRGDCPCWLTVEADNTVSVNGWFGTRSLFKVNGGFIDKKVPRGLVDVVANIGCLPEESRWIRTEKALLPA